MFVNFPEHIKTTKYVFTGAILTKLTRVVTLFCEFITILSCLNVLEIPGLILEQFWTFQTAKFGLSERNGDPIKSSFYIPRYHTVVNFVGFRRNLWLVPRDAERCKSLGQLYATSYNPSLGVWYYTYSKHLSDEIIVNEMSELSHN